MSGDFITDIALVLVLVTLENFVVSFLVLILREQILNPSLLSTV